MITLAWIDNEIEKSLRGDASAKNVYDLAALITVRAYLAAPSDAVQAEPTKEEAPKVYLSDYCADLDKVPRLEQVEQALAAVAVEDREQLKRAKDMKTWAGILGGKV